MAIYRGVLADWDSVNFLATVRLDGSAPQTLSGLRTSRAIATAEMMAGRRVLVDTGDHGDPADFVVTAVWAG
jgi:hypothetical protein